MRGDLFYRLLARGLDLTIWRGELLGRENQLVAGPAVYVANHAAALGPIAVAASISTRLYPWVVADMLDSQRAGPYLKHDFVEPQLRLSGWISTPVAGLLAVAAVHLLRGIECIPVSNDKNLLQTYRLSGEYLEKGRSILVFPEDPALPADEESGMRPFKSGFARLGTVFFTRTRQNLRFFPVAVHPGQRKVQLGEAIVFNPLNVASREHVRIARLLESTLRAMVEAQFHPLHRNVPPRARVK
jgi:hypothetical protein